jgi:hypothetical protein
VSADCDRVTMNIDPEQIEGRITPRTQAIMPAHMAGWPCDMKAIAARRDLVVIEDAADAFGASYRGRKIGRSSSFTAFSFYATKNIISGAAGVVTTDDDEGDSRISLLIATPSCGQCIGKTSAPASNPLPCTCTRATSNGSALGHGAFPTRGTLCTDQIPSSRRQP